MARKRVSRSIWDEARESNAPPTSILRAFLYEVQPVDLTQFDFNLNYIRHKSVGACQLAVRWLLSFIQCIVKFLYQRSLKEWGFVMVILVYWRVLVYFHQTLDAGPMLLILTALILIFTIGLGDHQDGETLSAYSGTCCMSTQKTSHRNGGFGSF